MTPSDHYSLTSEPIAIVVGTEPHTKTWHLPKELLLNASSFFAAALNGNFTEAKSKMIALPEDISDAFSLFARWLYIGKIGCVSVAPELEEMERVWAISKTLVQACILGDKLGCLIFRDLAMLKLIEHLSKEIMGEEEIRYVFDHSAQGSKLRQFTIDELRWVLQEGFLSDLACDFFSGATFAEDFGPVFLETSLKANGAAIDPQKQKERYLEVLTGSHGE